jgi:hypothetical protein
LLRQRVRLDVGKLTAAIRPDHDAADEPSIPPPFTEQRLVAVVERRPLDRLVREIELGNALGAVLLRFGAVFRGILSGRCRARTSSLRRV